MKRHAEAVRYALKAAELDDVDPLLLRRLGVYLTEEGDWAQAMALYEKALAARGRGQGNRRRHPPADGIGPALHLTKKYKQAADCFARVLYALDHPDEFAIDEPS